MDQSHCKSPVCAPSLTVFWNNFRRNQIGQCFRFPLYGVELPRRDHFTGANGAEKLRLKKKFPQCSELAPLLISVSIEHSHKMAAVDIKPVERVHKVRIQ